MRIILASGSPRRKELLARICGDFEIAVSGSEERRSRKRPHAVVMELAQQKAAAVAARIDGKAAVIGSDTIVVCGGEILGKPADGADAFRMLSKLSGRSHFVYTGVCVIIKKAGKKPEIIRFYERTEVRFRRLSDKEIRDYIATGDPMDKAGAYAAQGGAAPFVAGITGDFDTVVGLPVTALSRVLREHGVL